MRKLFLLEFVTSASDDRHKDEFIGLISTTFKIYVNPQDTRTYNRKEEAEETFPFLQGNFFLRARDRTGRMSDAALRSLHAPHSGLAPRSARILVRALEA